MIATVIKIAAMVVSVVMIIAVSLQESKSSGFSGVIGGGAEQLFGKKKSRGYDEILHRITFICLILYFVLALAALFINR